MSHDQCIQFIIIKSELPIGECDKIAHSDTPFGIFFINEIIGFISRCIFFDVLHLGLLPEFPLTNLPFVLSYKP